MTRLTVAWMSILATAIVGTVCYCLLHSKISEGAIVAMGGLLLTVVGKGAVAIIKRNAPDDEK